MSSTNRSTTRHPNDYYVTPITPIKDFLSAFSEVENIFSLKDLSILDPCSGGDKINPMSYPSALIESGVSACDILTVDVREDSLADIKGDFLELDQGEFDVVISNPPFKLAKEFIEKSLQQTKEGGFVIMLLRLNFFETKGRKPFFDKQMPKYAFVHHKRMSFTDDGKTDSVAYMHCIWEKGYYPDATELRII